jgi:hypothetical protein|tara:strand:+ start:961 stop:1923 length:963 start_codon:yes stop_codon:yes gene_type:complete
MTARSPLWYNSGDLQEMTSAEIVEWQEAAIFVYAQNPTAVLSVVSGSGNVSPTMADTRLQAGAMVEVDDGEAVEESETPEPSTVTVNYDKVSVAYTDIAGTSDSGTTFPVYQDNTGGTIQAMTLTDFKDTFIIPAINLMIVASESNNTGGTYTITTSSTAATGYTNVSTTALFADTRADTSAYTAGGIPETQDQPTTINSYFLHRRNGADSTPTRNLIYINGDNDLQEYAASDAKTLIGNWIRDEAGSSSSGNKITYSITADGSGGNARGTSMVDTRLNGSGNFQTGSETRSSTVYYYGQEFPNGTASTISTYTLRVTKA